MVMRLWPRFFGPPCRSKIICLSSSCLVTKISDLLLCLDTWTAKIVTIIVQNFSITWSFLRLVRRCGLFRLLATFLLTFFMYRPKRLRQNKLKRVFRDHAIVRKIISCVVDVLYPATSRVRNRTSNFLAMHLYI